MPKKEATIEEIALDDSDRDDMKFERTTQDAPKVKTLNRVKIDARLNDIPGALAYNILKKENNKGIQEWKSYPGITSIISLARGVIDKDNIGDVEKLAGMMQVHESQQSAAVIATIAVLVGNKLSEKIDKEIREAIGDVITWDVPLVSGDNDWPTRRKYAPRNMFSSSEEFSRMKMVVRVAQNFPSLR